MFANALIIPRSVQLSKVVLKFVPVPKPSWIPLWLIIKKIKKFLVFFSLLFPHPVYFRHTHRRESKNHPSPFHRFTTTPTYPGWQPLYFDFFLCATFSDFFLHFPPYLLHPSPFLLLLLILRLFGLQRHIPSYRRQCFFSSHTLWMGF